MEKWKINTGVFRLKLRPKELKVYCILFNNTNDENMVDVLEIGLYDFLGTYVENLAHSIRHLIQAGLIEKLSKSVFKINQPDGGDYIYVDHSLFDKNRDISFGELSLYLYVLALKNRRLLTNVNNIRDITGCARETIAARKKSLTEKGYIYTKKLGGGIFGGAINAVEVLELPEIKANNKKLNLNARDCI